MGVRVADCRADEWSLCVATPELKERLVRRTGRKKKWLKVENIPREAAFQHTARPTPGSKMRSDWSSNYPAALLLEESSKRAAPSVRHCGVFIREEVRFLHRSGLNDSTVRPFRGQEKASFVGRVDMLYQTNKQSWRELLPRLVAFFFLKKRIVKFGSDFNSIKWWYKERQTSQNL